MKKNPRRKERKLGEQESKEGEKQKEEKERMNDTKNPTKPSTSKQGPQQVLHAHMGPPMFAKTQTYLL